MSKLKIVWPYLRASTYNVPIFMKQEVVSLGDYVQQDWMDSSVSADRTDRVSLNSPIHLHTFYVKCG